MGLCSSNCNYCSSVPKANIDISQLNGESTLLLTGYSREIDKIIFLQIRLKVFIKRLHQKNGKVSSSLFKIKKQLASGSFASISTSPAIAKEIKEDDSSYIGQIVNGVREGYGILKWDSFKYIGQFSDNKPNGYGRLIDRNFNIYWGFFNNFSIEGIGRYKCTSALGMEMSYEGNWFKHKQEGFGIEKWNKTSVYRGEYKNGLRDGVGVICFKGLTGYEGEFQNGEMNGRGTFYFNDKRKFQGQWKKNKMNGYGIITWPDGKVFEGKFVNDNKEGLGILYALSKVYIGNWSNNNLIGKVIIISNGKIQKQLWANGKPIRSINPNEITTFDKLISADLLKYSNAVSTRTTKSTNGNMIE